jgi:hypothetical protein
MRSLPAAYLESVFVVKRESRALASVEYTSPPFREHGEAPRLLVSTVFGPQLDALGFLPLAHHRLRPPVCVVVMVWRESWDRVEFTGQAFLGTFETAK